MEQIQPIKELVFDYVTIKAEWSDLTRERAGLAGVVSHVTLDNVIRACYSAQHVGKQRSVGGIA